MIVHWIRLNFQLLRMSFLAVAFLLNRISLFFDTDLSNPKCSTNSELAGLWSGSLRRNSSTERFLPRHITTQDFELYPVVEGI